MAEMRALGSSGMSTPPLVLGGNVFGWTSFAPDCFDIMDAFIAKGGNTIDTADYYSVWHPGNSGGDSEKLIGEWLRRRGRRDDVQIITKVGLMPGEGGVKLQPGRVLKAVDESLARLKTDYIDIYMAHIDDPDVPQEDLAACFDGLVKAGKVRAIGCSNFTADRLASALDIAAANGLTPYTVIQPELHLMKRERYEGDIQKLAIERGLGVVPFFTLASGFLTGKYRRGAGELEGNARKRFLEPFMTAKGDAVLAAMDKVVAQTGATHAQVALAWNAAQPGVTAPIASATSVAQLDDIMGSIGLALTSDQLATLDAASLA